ncbi:MAG: hypothetical protein JWR04_128 [Rhodoglobus sp.]|jgi:hypothetical protein|nr:hypothetical protein [Rhodoglobus sp.]
MRLPPVLSADDLPAPELYAARLDGQLFAVDACFAPVDEIEQPRHRASALLSGLGGKLIAEQLSAAWVWGALDAPPAHHQFCVATGARVSHSPARWMTVREVVIEADELVDLGGALVTDPTRTLVDLARFGAGFDFAVAARLIAAGASVDRALASVVARRNLPNKKTTLGRLSRC